MRTFRFAAPAFLFSTAALTAIATVSAASFPDVSATYPHRIAIEQLVNRGVISGHPDGNFRPYDPVDRASILKMLYKSAGISADGGKKGCLKDVPDDAWYASFVCDAVARGYVKGYDDGNFKPGRAVSRSEALKLSIAIIGIPSADLSATVKMYADVGSTDWFASYVHTALARKILPIDGQNGTMFNPHALLERGEAAAYIWNTLEAKKNFVTDNLPIPTIPSSSAGVSSKAATTGGNASSGRKRVDDPVSTDVIVQTTVPFKDERVLGNNKPLSYRFRVDTAMTLQADVTIGASDGGRITCRLYRLEPSRISDEYYLGMEEGKGCYLRSALTQGEYQLQVQPTVAGSRVTVDVRATGGDGNDGFSQAKPLQPNKVKVDLLDANDLEDWFSFTVKENTSVTTVPGTNMAVHLTSSATLGCIIYPLSDVDLFGFKGPNCNETYLFPQGTYLVSVRHSVPRQSKQTYSIELK